MVSATAATMVQPMARPSRPSVRLTALLAPAMTIITKATKGTKASQCRCGMWPSQFQTRSGRRCLAKGTTRRVE
jgi:hypothetical protein